MTDPLPMGSVTPWGKIGAIVLTAGERYYMIVANDGAVALLPADVVEAERG